MLAGRDIGIFVGVLTMDAAYLSIHLSISLSIYLSIYLSNYLSI